MATKKNTAKRETVRPLTIKEEKFVQEYVKSGNALQSYKAAGYQAKTDQAAGVMGHQLLSKPKIAQAVAAMMALAEKRTEVTFDRWINETAGIAFSDIRRLFNADGTLKAPKDLDDYAAASVSSIEVYEEYAGKGPHRTLVGYTKKIKLWDKLAALDKLAKRFGWLKETPIQHITNVTVVDDNQRDEILRAAFARVVRGSGPTLADREATADESRLALAPPGADHGDGGDDSGRDAKNDPLF